MNQFICVLCIWRSLLTHGVPYFCLKNPEINALAQCCTIVGTQPAFFIRVYNRRKSIKLKHDVPLWSVLDFLLVLYHDDAFSAVEKSVVVWYADI